MVCRLAKHRQMLHNSAMGNLKDNLTTLMEEAHINVSELARKVGIGQPVLHRIMAGETTNPNVNTLSPIAKFFSISISELIGDSPISSLRLPGEVKPKISEIPILKLNDVIEWLDNNENDILPEGIGFTDASLEDPQKAFSIRLVDSSFEPKYSQGTLFIFDHTRQPMNKNIALFYKEGDSTPSLRQFIKDGSDIYLKSLNPEISEIKPHKKTKKDRLLGVAIQIQTNTI
jgi:SOS-response transcriptional repressor LexA